VAETLIGDVTWSSSASMSEVRSSLPTLEDEAELLAFELANRDYFARAVGDRGDEYFASFPDRLRSLVEENDAGTVMMFVVRDAGGRVVGRVNVVDILDGSADLGYRIAEDAGGRGYARGPRVWPSRRPPTEVCARSPR
jgi:ribosomal-protein-alanine N-acetyltransferase